MPFFRDQQGRQIYYEVHGTAGPPLVLLHGLSSSARIWEPQIKDFIGHFQVFAFDYPGHGQSDWVDHYSMADFAQLTVEFMDHLALAKAHILALSIGCNVALTVACRQPERVLSLVLEGPSGGITPPWTMKGRIKMGLIWSYLGLLYVLYKMVGKPKTAHLINKYGPQTIHYSVLLAHLESEVDPKALKQLTLDNAYPPYINRLHCVTAPILIVRGVRDGFPRRYSFHIHDQVQSPCLILEIPKARHVVALEQPEIFNWLAIQFIQDAEGPKLLDRWGAHVLND